MAITAIVYSSPTFPAGELCSVHNPLAFIVEAQYDNGTTPDELFCDIKDSNGNSIGVFNMMFYLDLSPTSRMFIIYVDELLRAYMPSFDDVQQNLNTGDPTWQLIAMTADFNLIFQETESGTGKSIDIDITAVNTTRQFAENPILDDLYNNTDNFTYLSYHDMPCYLYFYNKTDNADFEETVTQTTKTGAAIGFWRMKFLGTGSDFTASIEINQTQVASHEVIGNEFCTGQKLIKYIDRNGQYRFIAFNTQYETRTNPKLIGKINPLFASIIDGQSNEKNIGYTGKKTLTLTNDELTTSESNLIEDLLNSPRVYLLNNYTLDADDGDYLSDWLLVEVQANNGILKNSKGDKLVCEITVVLPEHFTIKMI